MFKLAPNFINPQFRIRCNKFRFRARGMFFNRMIVNVLLCVRAKNDHMPDGAQIGLEVGYRVIRIGIFDSNRYDLLSN